MNRAKIKVVWLCHFSNSLIRSRIKATPNLLDSYIRKLLKKKPMHDKDFAPWINNLIKEFERFDDVELHVISPYSSLPKLYMEFEENGIHYCFYKPDRAMQLYKLWCRLFSIQRPKYPISRHIVKRFIRQIEPDIVNLIGTENPYYSLASLDIKRIPVFVSVQTVYSNPERELQGGVADRFRWDLELKIHKKFKYYGCGGRMHRDLVLMNNSQAIIFKLFFPIQSPPDIPEQTKVFDFVFFAAGVAKKKGIEDALEALAIVKHRYPKVTLNVVGKCEKYYKEFLLSRLKMLDIFENVSFNEYFPIHEDMHKHVKKAKYAVLPVKLDVIPSAVIEAILLELPLVTYRTSGTPYLNRYQETILLADIGDVEALAANMMRLMDTPDLGVSLKTRALAFVKEVFDNEQSARRLVSDYHAVLDHFHSNIDIPSELLFSTEEFPIYRSRDA